jgi:hypothetical protein
MWDPQRLTTLRAFMACYRDSFTLPYLYHSIRSGSGAHPSLLLNGYRGFYARDVKLTTGAIPPVPHYVFMVWCLIN